MRRSEATPPQVPGWAGLSPRARTMVSGAARALLSMAEGASDFRPLCRYVFADGRVVREQRQQASWHSGPVWFLTLVDDAGAPVPGADWTAEEIARYLSPSPARVPA